jgi:HEPN domain-containing protein
MDRMAKRRLVLAWFAKSESDLQAATTLITGERTQRDVGVYHCQQAAEKAIKGLLTLHDLQFPKTHDLEILVGLLEPAIPECSHFARHAALLTPYATEFRYPGDVFEPSAADAAQALELAEEIQAFLRRASGFTALGPEDNAELR